MKKMKRCPKCGACLDEDDAVCFNCGAHQKKPIDVLKVTNVEKRSTKDFVDSKIEEAKSYPRELTAEVYL